MRIDKFLKASRLVKRRTVANQVCAASRVLINTKIAKPGSSVKIGDIIEILFGTHTVKVKVISLCQHTSKTSSKEMYEIIS